MASVAGQVDDAPQLPAADDNWPVASLSSIVSSAIAATHSNLLGHRRDGFPSGPRVTASARAFSFDNPFFNVAGLGATAFVPRGLLAIATRLGAAVGALVAMLPIGGTVKNRNAAGGLRSCALCTSLMACVMLLSTGCTAVKAFHADPDARENLKLDVKTAVVGYIGAAGQTAQGMAEEAQRVIRVAQKIKESAQTDLSYGDVRALLLAGALRKLDVEDRPWLRPAADLILLRIERRVKIDLTLVSADAFPMTRELIIENCDAAIEAATPYLNAHGSLSVGLDADVRSLWLARRVGLRLIPSPRWRNA